MTNKYAGKCVTIMGLGLFGAGVGAARFFSERGAMVTVTDLKGPEELADSIDKLRGCNVTYRLRRHRRSDFINADIVVPSPAVPKDAQLLKLARERGAILEPEMNIFVSRCPANVIGVTGTNGKTTTSALIGRILESAGRRNWLGGNIGRSLLADLPRMRSDDIVVLELSSFQLEWLPETDRSPHISIVTNISPDHLDRHGSMENYKAAKWAIMSNQRVHGDWAVLNADCRALDAWRSKVNSRLLLFSSTQQLDIGVFCKRTGRNGMITARLGGSERAIAPLDALRIPGRHNLENALAAVAACVILGLPPSEIEAGLRSFTGVEHRLELVAESGGVRYYNDSKATTPDSTMVAIEAFDCPIVLIAGGSGKGLSFEEMAGKLVGRARGVVALGRTGPEIARWVREKSGGSIETVHSVSLQDAVSVARRMAQPGDVILLSPGDASFDMFSNFEKRGEAFKLEVSRIAADQSG